MNFTNHFPEKPTPIGREKTNASELKLKLKDGRIVSPELKDRPQIHYPSQKLTVFPRV